jgi:hypothetical protein
MLAMCSYTGAARPVEKKNKWRYVHLFVVASVLSCWESSHEWVVNPIVAEGGVTVEISEIQLYGSE